MPNLKLFAWILPATVLMFASVWYWVKDSQHRVHLLDFYALEQSPDFTVHQINYRQYDKQGKVTHYLTAPKMHHIPKNDQHIFTHPHLLVTETNQEHWDIFANQATAVSKGQNISLDYHVLINQHKNHQDTSLKTEHLIYYPHDKKATSAVAVTVTRGASELQANGMIADLAEHHIQFLQARGRHERNPAQK